jgi:hypothetical protein
VAVLTRFQNEPAVVSLLLLLVSVLQNLFLYLQIMLCVLRIVAFTVRCPAQPYTQGPTFEPTYPRVQDHSAVRSAWRADIAENAAVALAAASNPIS